MTQLLDKRQVATELGVTFMTFSSCYNQLPKFPQPVKKKPRYFFSADALAEWQAKYDAKTEIKIIQKRQNAKQRGDLKNTPGSDLLRKRFISRPLVNKPVSHPLPERLKGYRATVHLQSDI